MFLHLPLGVQEEDYSAVKNVIDQLRRDGVGDLKNYWCENPKLLRSMVEGILCTKANKALLKLHKVETEEDFIKE